MLKKIKNIIKHYIFSLNKNFEKIKQNIKAIIFKKTGCVLNTNNGHAKFYLPNYSIDYIQNTIYKTKDYFEKDNLEYVCKKWRGGIISTVINNHGVLDIGSNIGNHTIYYANECNANLIYCFEPIAKTFNVLSKNIKLNNLESITKLYQVGVGAFSTNANIDFYDEKNIGGTKLIINAYGDIPVVSIDELKISNIGLVKVDVEGLEVEVLKGMLTTLEENHPYITIEIRDKNFEEAFQILSKLGYSYIEIEKHRDYRDYNDYLFYHIQ